MVPGLLEQIRGESRNFKRKCKLFCQQFFQTVKEVSINKMLQVSIKKLLKRMEIHFKLYRFGIEWQLANN